MKAVSKTACLIAILMACHVYYPGNAQMLFRQVQGLSHNTGFSLYQDRQGFIWIGTGNGLNRYDGSEVKVYKPSIQYREGEMQGRVIKSRILEDDSDRLWFSTELALHCFDKRTERYTCFVLTDSNSRNTGVAANPVLIKNDFLWLANTNEGVYCLNTRNKQVVRYPVTEKDEQGNTINIMYHGVPGGTSKLGFASAKGLLSFDIDTHRWKLELKGNFYALSYRRDTIFLASGSQIISFNTRTAATGRIKTDLQHPNEIFHTLYTDQRNRIWVGDAKGNVYTVSDAELIWKGNINGNTPLKTGFPVYGFCTDTSGILWAGGYSVGICQAEITENAFHNWPPATAEPVYVNAVYEAADGTILLGTFDNGIVAVDKTTGNSRSVSLPDVDPQMIYGNAVHLLKEDSRGNLWSSISGHLLVRKKGGKRFTSVRIPVPANALIVPQLWSIAEYSDGWLIGTTVGLYYLTEINGRYHFDYRSEFGENRIADIWVSPRQEIWLAYENGGIAVSGGLGSIETPVTRFRHDNIRGFVYDPVRELLWLSSSGGLICYHYPSGKYRYYTEDDGLLNSYLSACILLENQLWVSTALGIAKGEIFFEAGAVFPDIHFTQFTTADGLHGNTFSPRAFSKGRNGLVYFGTSTGVLWFDPGKIQIRSSDPPIKMMELMVNEAGAGETAPGYVTGLVLRYNQNSLLFRFRAIDYRHAQTLRYAYRLEGWDREWIYSKTANEVRYGNLPPGNYVFRVRSTNGSGAWSASAYRLDVKISPPFWKTWWFRLLVTISALFAIVWTTRYISENRLKERIRELEKQKALEEERKRISREMHDDIGAGLTRITLMSEIARYHPGSKELGDIADTSRQLVNSMNEIIWSIDPEHRSLDHLFAYLREQLHGLLEPSGIDYSISFPDDAGNILLTNDNKRNILMVCKEIVHNAIKHSRAERIEISAWLEKEVLHFRIHDNGTGFVKDEISRGNGLNNLQHRLSGLNAVFSIETAPGKGVLACFSIPLNSH